MHNLINSRKFFQSNSHKVLSIGLFGLGSAQIIKRIIRLISSIIIARLLTPEKDDKGQILTIHQMPKLTNINPAHLLCRNPVGNGSAPVIIKQTFNEIAFKSQLKIPSEWCYFDEQFRQSEDTECWLRIISTTQCKIEGISPALTYYRLNNQGLSSNLMKQLASIHNNDGKDVVYFINQALYLASTILKNDRGRTLATLVAAYMLYLLPLSTYKRCEKLGHNIIGNVQKRG